MPGGGATLTPQRETVGEQARETGGEDFSAGAFDVVTHPALLDQIFVGVVDAIGGAPIAVAGLPDAAGVDEIFFAKLDMNLFPLGPMSAFIADKGALDVGMTKEADSGVLVSETGGGIEIAKDIAPLPRGIEGGVNDGKIADLALET